MGRDVKGGRQIGGGSLFQGLPLQGLKADHRHRHENAWQRAVGPGWVGRRHDNDDDDDAT